jgi:hypothetical protein
MRKCRKVTMIFATGHTFQEIFFVTPERPFEEVLSIVKKLRALVKYFDTCQEKN